MADFNRSRGPRRNFEKRDFRKRDFGGRGGDRGNREMFSATCSNCGRECQVPFRPTGSRPVLCSDCFQKNDEGSSPRRFESRPARPPRFENRSEQGVTKEQFEELNAKVDKILAILTDVVTSASEE